MKRKLLIAVMATVLCCLFTVQAFAAPYQNYNFNRGWVTAEPQAYVPYKVLDAVSMGVLTNDGTEGLDFKEPQDMAISTKNGDIAIADRGNSRVVIINKSYILKQYISPKRTSSVTELILDDNGEPKLDADGNKQYKTIEVDITGFDFKGKREKLTAPEGVTFDNEGGLYICDTGNSRIIRFVLSGDEYVCDFIFEKPEGLDDLLSSGGDTQTQTSRGYY